MFVGRLNDLVQCAERLFVETARTEHMARHARRIVGAVHGDDVSAHHGAAHLANRRQRIVDLETVRQTPRIEFRERQVVLDELQIRDVPGDETEWLVAFKQPVAARGDEIAGDGLGADDGRGEKEEASKGEQVQVFHEILPHWQTPGAFAGAGAASM